MINNRLASRIIVGIPIDPEQQISRLLLTLILGGLLTLLVAIAGGYWLAGQALWPVHAITRTARDISESDLSKRLNLRTRDELGELAGTFDRMLDRLEAAFKRQRQFTADASHELRTPLSIISLETGRALSARRPAEEYRRTLEVVQSENNFMTRLVEELLMLARMDSGQMHLKREPLDLSETAADVVDRFLPLAVRRGVELQAGELPELIVEGDRTLLGQMIGNLVDNAIKYTPNGNGGPHWVRVEAGESNDQAIAWLRVSDNGPGIPAEHLPHLFDRFYRVDQARSHNLGDENSEEDMPGSGQSGSGLGLSIVQWIAEIHGGKVSVSSTPGSGTAFEITLPLKPGSALN